MATRSALGRDARGRFIPYEEELRRQDAVFRARQPWVDPKRPSDAMILANPTDRYPRYRLRVFDTVWPWRVTRGSALGDALSSGNARRDRDDRQLYLDACANIQRDPPYQMDTWRARARREKGSTIGEDIERE